MKAFSVTKFLSALLIAVFAFSAFAAPSALAAQSTHKGKTIVDVVLEENAKSGEFSILIAALQAADPRGLQALSSRGKYTVFAPTDAAFAALLDELDVTAEELLSDQDTLTKVLGYHVALKRLDSKKVLASQKIKMGYGGYLYQSGGVLTDENGRSANIIAVDIKASNGIIHVIDRVVLPKGPEKPNTIVDVVLAENAKSGEFSILIAALQAADPRVLQSLGSPGQFTVFAPTDAAFASLLTELGVTADELLSNKDLVTQVLGYHVALAKLDSSQVLASDKIQMSYGGYLYQSGGILTDENGRTANIVAVDIKASNGIIHVIDRVVLPKQPEQQKTIVDVVLEENAKSGEFSILIAALKAADPRGLEALSSPGTYTVFAPTDAAFVALLAELGVTADELLSNTDLVTKVLGYHVALAKLDSTQVLASEKIQMGYGGHLWQSGGVLTDNKGRTANIIAVDIGASNGIIHVIDRVVLP